MLEGLDDELADPPNILTWRRLEPEKTTLQYYPLDYYLTRAILYLDISVNIEPVVLAGQHDAAVPHEGHVETLGVLHLALQGSDQLGRETMVRCSRKNPIKQWIKLHYEGPRCRDG